MKYVELENTSFRNYLQGIASRSYTLDMFFEQIATLVAENLRGGGASLAASERELILPKVEYFFKLMANCIGDEESVKDEIIARDIDIRFPDLFSEVVSSIVIETKSFILNAQIKGAKLEYALAKQSLVEEAKAAHYDYALSCCEEGLRWQPSHHEMLVIRFQIFLDRDKLSDAIGAAEAILENYPNNDVLLYLANKFLDKREYEKAIVFCGKIIQNPLQKVETRRQAFRGEINAYCKMGEYKEALACATQAVKIGFTEKVFFKEITRLIINHMLKPFQDREISEGSPEWYFYVDNLKVASNSCVAALNCGSPVAEDYRNMMIIIAQMEQFKMLEEISRARGALAAYFTLNGSGAVGVVASPASSASSLFAIPRGVLAGAAGAESGAASSSQTTAGPRLAFNMDEVD